MTVDEIAKLIVILLMLATSCWIFLSFAEKFNTEESMKAKKNKSLRREKVTITDLKRKGDGKRFPVRPVTQVYDKKGVVVAEFDMCGSFSIEQLYEFAERCLKEPSKNVDEHFQEWDPRSPCRPVY